MQANKAKSYTNTSSTGFGGTAPSPLCVSFPKWIHYTNMASAAHTMKFTGFSKMLCKLRGNFFSSKLSISVCPVCDDTQCWPQCQNPWWKWYFPWHGNDHKCNSHKQEYQPNSQNVSHTQAYSCCGKISSTTRKKEWVGMTAVIFDKMAQLLSCSLSWYPRKDFYF